MKILFVLVLAVALSLAAIWALPLLRGYVLIRADGWAVEMNVFVLLSLLATLYLTIRLAVWAWRLPGNALRRFFQRRAAAQLEIGMMALSEGDWRKAEKALSKAARNSDQTALSYLGAAQAAHAKGDESRMEQYLEHADQTAGAHDSVLITRASLQLSSGDPESALKTLDEVSRSRSGRPRVLELKARCHEQLGQWQELAALAPQLRKAEIIDQPQADRIVRQAALQRLEQAPDSAALAAAWKSVARELRTEEAFVAAYGRNAIALGAPDLAEKELRAALNRDWSESLLALFIQATTGDGNKRIQQLEKWLAAQPDSPLLHRQIGRHCISRELWGKAREHLETSAALRADPETLGELAELKLKSGDTDAALEDFRKAVSRATPGSGALLGSESTEGKPAAG